MNTDHAICRCDRCNLPSPFPGVCNRCVPIGRRTEQAQAGQSWRKAPWADDRVAYYAARAEAGLPLFGEGGR